MLHKCKEKIYGVFDRAFDIINSFFSIEYEQTCILPDWLFLKLKYKKRMGKPLNLFHPKTYTEKIQWLKLHDRRSKYSKIVDKYEAKKIVTNIIGGEHIIPAYGVWNSFDDINFDELPKQFVLKCTHDSGGVYIVNDKNSIDYEGIKKFFSVHMNRNFYKHNREWPYKNVCPRIIAEKYMQDESGYELKDYKIFTFNGKAKAVQVDFGRFINHKRNLYSLDWKKLPYSINYESDDSVIIMRPDCLDEMIMAAECLGKDFYHARIDFYVAQNEFYFGEITFFPGGGFEKFSDENMDLQWGNWIEIPIKEKR